MGSQGTLQAVRRQSLDDRDSECTKLLELTTDIVVEGEELTQPQTGIVRMAARPLVS